MVTVTLDPPRTVNGIPTARLVFPDATRVSTDEHNNLEVWGGEDGDDLAWVCAQGNWVDVTIGEPDDGS